MGNGGYMNKVFLIGRLTNDTELATTASGINYCRFSLAVGRPHSKENETDFFNIVAWRGLAENCAKYLKKGSQCAIVGTLQNNTYEKDGTRLTVTQIVADEVEFLQSLKNTERKVENRTQTALQTELTPISDDDLPF